MMGRSADVAAILCTFSFFALVAYEVTSDDQLCAIGIACALLALVVISI